MGRKALLAVLCWVTFSGTLAKDENVSNTLVTKDNISEGSAPRLYRNVPVIGVYASAAPHADYSFHIPRFVTAPKTAASRVIPVKEELIVHNPNTFLKDSYGNRFVGTPQSAYKTSFPQQFVQLQGLPVHLVNPLPATVPSYQIKQAAPQIIYGSQYRIPSLQTAVPTPINRFTGFTQPLVYAQNIQHVAPSHTIQVNSQAQRLAAPKQSTINNGVFQNSQAIIKYTDLKNEPKFQRLEERPKDNVVAKHESGLISSRQVDKEQLQESPGTQTYTTVVNGQKTVINVETKPPVPLLDLTLLEPLHFDNPVVPQVQHFLPRINQATYQELPEFNLDGKKQQKKTNSEGQQKKLTKKKQKKPSYNENTPQKHIPVKPTITITNTPNDGPELTYEINSPNYKETYKEQVVSYNKETKPKPVNYNYEHKTVKEPVTYSYGKTVQKAPVYHSYVHSSKEPMQIKEVHYENNGQPKHLVYSFKQEENDEEQRDTPPRHPPQSESGETNSSEENDEDDHNYHHEEYEETPRHGEQLRPEHREEYHTPPSSNHYSQPHNVPVHYELDVQPVTKEYEENIRLNPTQGPNAAVKVDPNQHIQRPTPAVLHQNHRPSPIPQLHQQHPTVPIIHQQHQTQRPSPIRHRHHQHHQHQPEQRHNNEPVPHILEKSKHIIIQEETPEEVHSHQENFMAKMREQEENNEEDFEKAYKDAAYGFPAYGKSTDDLEKDIYNADSYGVPRDDAEYDIEHTPFQAYEAEGDNFPKSARLIYKDARDNMKKDYYSDYSISKPESLVDYRKKKQDYYKTYNKYKPEKYFSNEDNNKKQKEKYTAASVFNFGSEPKKNNDYFAQYKASPQKYQYEYDYAKEAPRNKDSTAHASRPYQRYKSRTYFVEPQFQYGFEPISLPRLLDSELAAMATNNSPESEKPGMRKKVYKENWYIKKTSTAGGKPAS
ncbi:myb-like protein AA [Achroia grisella]|uniref:myb-like protein AA n=1 Tax=Achroia grisella TaxID=688607 RepID=UPI0027D343CC|nr:myb-like protein AA [Achroia grisella]